ncbi:hypothetical protein RUM43_014815 [Polyplax serrata]|uniref:Uncharacterized protein n=1 Tax=Polyplax serrata TaxID=468196 RepID=A0AAN8NY51_POLSC
MKETEDQRDLKEVVEAVAGAAAAAVVAAAGKTEPKVRGDEERSAQDRISQAEVPGALGPGPGARRRSRRGIRRLIDSDPMQSIINNLHSWVAKKEWWKAEKNKMRLSQESAAVRTGKKLQVDGDAERRRKEKRKSSLSCG